MQGERVSSSAKPGFYASTPWLVFVFIVFIVSAEAAALGWIVGMPWYLPTIGLGSATIGVVGSTISYILARRSK